MCLEVVGNDKVAYSSANDSHSLWSGSVCSALRFQLQDKIIEPLKQSVTYRSATKKRIDVILIGPAISYPLVLN